MMRMLVLVVCIGCGGAPRPVAHRGHVDEDEASPPTNPCASPAGPELVRCVHAHVVEVTATDDGSELILDIGAVAGVSKNWQGNVLGPADNPIAPITIVRVEDRRTIARTHLAADRMNTNTLVALARGQTPATPTCDTYDPRNPACAHDCRFGDCKCPSPPNADIPACQAIMACPDPPDSRIRACQIEDCFDASCGKVPGPVLARVIQAAPEGGDLIITIAVGSDNGVGKNWHGVILSGDSDQPLTEIVVLRVAKRQLVARVHLSMKDIETNPRVRLTPPDT